MLSTDQLAMISSAIAGGALFGGGLLRLPAPDDGWAITTEVPERTLAEFRAPHASAVVTSDVLGLGPSWVCWVFGYQVGGIQHRVFLPLLGAAVGDLIQSAKTCDVRLLMDAAGAESALQARLPASSGLVASLQQQWHAGASSPRSGEYLLLTAARLLAPAALAPADGVQRPSTVTVTAVIPDDVAFDVDGAAMDALRHAAAVRHKGGR